MLKTAALALATTLTFIGAAQAGDRYDRVYQQPAPFSGGVVNNYYGPTTVYQGGTPAYRYDYGNAAPAYAPSYGASYGNAYAGAYAGAYADSYGASYGTSYGAPWGPPFAGGVGYSPYGYGGGYGSVTVPFYSGARQDPWNGYNWAPGNGYW